MQRVWYDGGAFGWILRPLSGLYWLVSRLRAWLYSRGVFSTHKVSVPVVVVGNITAGGTGKTPTVIWLVNEMRDRGYQPGIISRGYGGSKSGTSMRVDADSEAAVVGDEPVLLARRAACPVAVDADRVRAASMLVDDGVNVIIADDGLQHLRLQRDFEICVVDGVRGLGNRRLLPAGPMRESEDRLQSVDQVLINGNEDIDLRGTHFVLLPADAERVNGSATKALREFAGSTVHAVAAIGNPARFFDMLRQHEIDVVEHAFADHASLGRADLDFGDELEVLMTEKDAVKLGRSIANRFWYVPVNLSMEAVSVATLMQQLEARLATGGDAA
ncbi:MAG: tetraacyldisaccharide 4'-kinase [Gammaproteobacteria bacterium]|nr:tetraacyldisaccharide 4'-kinase [Gammaproteobacteria bacterium]